MIMCSRCKKRPAVVFVSQTNDASKSQGLCLTCAKELGIKPVNDMMQDMMNKLGITEEQLEAMTEEMSALAETDDNEDFTPGGTASMPIEQIFGGGANGFSQNGFDPSQPPKSGGAKKEDFHKQKRKHIMES